MIDKQLRDRYSRQTMFPGIGEAGQERLSKSTAVLIGCGALGCTSAGLLARAGVGRIRIVDRDFIERHNLQRQVLFDEEDIEAGLPKAVAAARHLKKANSSIEIEAVVADVNCTNIEELCSGADLILDGTDNFETRFLVNDAALKHGIPWIYGGAVGSEGMTMTIVPKQPPCFRCASEAAPEPGTVPTCETAGVLGMAPALVGALQAAEAIKILTGVTAVSRELVFADVWKGTFHRVKVEPRKDCPACQGKYEFLTSRFDIKSTSLCGQSRAVQVVDANVKAIDLEKLASRLKKAGPVVRSEFMLSFTADGHHIVVFPDGRAIIKNTIDQSRAKELYDRYIGPLARGNASARAVQTKHG
ncbi:MAG: ThiF family adenylyltransferase [Dehalococcoidia bacterium]|nr:ThiF family adenylyltransferase [Dehalococcoidia bacterium]